MVGHPAKRREPGRRPSERELEENLGTDSGADGGRQNSKVQDLALLTGAPDGGLGPAKG